MLLQARPENETSVLGKRAATPEGLHIITPAKRPETSRQAHNKPAALRSLIRAKPDGLCYWRCTLDRIKSLDPECSTLDFLNGECDEIKFRISLFRMELADMLTRLRHEKDTDPSKSRIWNDEILPLIPDLPDAAPGDVTDIILDKWLDRMFTFVDILEKDKEHPRSVWVDELGVRMTSLYFEDKNLNVKFGVINPRWRRNRAALDQGGRQDPADDQITYNLVWHTDNDGNGQHFDILV